MKFTPFLATALVLSAVSPQAQPQAREVRRVATPRARAEVASPLVAQETWGSSAIVVQPVAERLARLGRLQAARLTSVPVPVLDSESGRSSFDEVDLELERFEVLSPRFALHVDGRRVGGSESVDVSLWRGQVAGEPDSDVFLAVTSTGTRGWIQRASGRSLIVSYPAGGDDWSNASSVIVDSTDPMIVGIVGGVGAAGGEVPFACGSDQLATVPGTDLLRSVTAVREPPTARGSSAPRLCDMAIETDHQFWQLFNDTTAATNYAVSLMAAVSLRFEASTNTLIQMPYLGIYSDSADPWTTPETPDASTIDMLGEFRTAWAGGTLPPGVPAEDTADLAHFISGESLGGGVAYVDVLCNQDFGFAVSANLHGQLNFPVPTSDGLNWDFVVVAHETGHNFGTGHTHNYCPPIDECAPDGYFGSCQTAQTCITDGTLMGYCHLCPGGISNVQTEFHPDVAAVMTAAVDASCLAPAVVASSSVRNGSGTNALAYTELTPSVLGTDWDTFVDWTASDPDGIGTALIIAVGGPLEVDLSIGQLLVAPPFLTPSDVTLGVAPGGHSIPIPSDMSLLGLNLYTQGASIEPGFKLELFNAIDITLGF